MVVLSADSKSLSGLQLARDLAMVGNYTAALCEYDQVLESVSSSDYYRKEIIEEVNLIKKIESEFASLKNVNVVNPAVDACDLLNEPPPALPVRPTPRKEVYSTPRRKGRKPIVPKVAPPTVEMPKGGGYLSHIYGESRVGPDSDLIQMIERDCVENSVAVCWEDIAGLESVKELLQEAVTLPLLIPNYFKGIRRPWRGVLLFGPPGTGKTLLAKAVATECKSTFFNVSASSLASKYRGESEKLVRILFDMARFYAPTVIFFDEIDALGSKRGESSEHEASRRVKSELLVQMDGVVGANGGGSVTVLAATNRPWDIDEALRRRLEKRIYIPLPDKEGREKIFKICLTELTLGNDVNISELVKLCNNYSGADLTNVCREAAMMGLRKKMREARQLGISPMDVGGMDTIEQVPVTQRDFLEAISNVQKSVGNDDLQKFMEWTAEFGSV